MVLTPHIFKRHKKSPSVQGLQTIMASTHAEFQNYVNEYPVLLGKNNLQYTNAFLIPFHNSDHTIQRDVEEISFIFLSITVKQKINSNLLKANFKAIFPANDFRHTKR